MYIAWVHVKALLNHRPFGKPRDATSGGKRVDRDHRSKMGCSLADSRKLTMD